MGMPFSGARQNTYADLGYIEQVRQAREGSYPQDSAISEAKWSGVEALPPAGILPAPDDAAVLSALSEMG